MQRIQSVDVFNAKGPQKELFEQVQKKMGRVPNILKTLGHSPAALQAYLGFSGALAQAAIPDKVREQIALLVAEENQCDYCLAAHAAIGKMAGLKDQEISDTRKGQAEDPKLQALLRFVQAITQKKGFVSDEDLRDVRNAGYGDEEIVEMVASVALNIYTNYINHVAQTEVDFPKVPALAGQAK